MQPSERIKRVARRRMRGVYGVIIWSVAEWCPSGRRSGPGKLVVVKSGSWVRIPPTPPDFFKSSGQSMNPSVEEQARRDQVFLRILQYIREDRTIRLPAFDRSQPPAAADFALLAIE